jgi:predicted Zn-dependent protease
MKHANIMQYIYTAAVFAVLIALSGGVGIGLYYLLQYGFAGLGLLLSLEILGVSRDSEREADILGEQTMWNAGFDPNGFTDFFDAMATNYGHVQSSSFFATHPAFYDRIHDAEAEARYLPHKDNLIKDSPEFQEVRNQLKELHQIRYERVRKIEQSAPTLGTPQPSCEENKDNENGKEMDTKGNQAAWCAAPATGRS